ncbi:unnamed protein product, partial [Pylaiella littoralis]
MRVSWGSTDGSNPDPRDPPPLNLCRLVGFSESHRFPLPSFVSLVCCAATIWFHILISFQRSLLAGVGLLARITAVDVSPRCMIGGTSIFVSAAEMPHPSTLRKPTAAELLRCTHIVSYCAFQGGVHLVVT